MSSVPTYQIVKGDDTPCKLVSVVLGKGWGGEVDTKFVNFVASGTFTYCIDLKSKLEEVKE